MPISHRFDSSMNVLFVEMRGALSDEELLQYAKTATTDTEIPRFCHELIDLRGAEGQGASTESLRRVAATFQDAEQAPEGVKIALVASSDAAYGIARMYQAFRAGSQAVFHVFRQMDEARAWLGLPPE
jgi:ATP phosphoribosyltransferase regulatory subunit HisZ